MQEYIEDIYGNVYFLSDISIISPTNKHLEDSLMEVYVKVDKENKRKGQQIRLRKQM